MPSIPLVTRETPSSSYSRSTATATADQMCRDGPCVHLSAEEKIAAEEALKAYCKPVELYNILQRRASRHPLFLQRCLHYRIQSKIKRRIQLTVSITRAVHEGAQAQSIFPLYVLLARHVSEISTAEDSKVYRFNRACLLTNFVGVEGCSQTQAQIILPEIHKLAVEAKSDSLSILIISFAGTQTSSLGNDLTKNHLANTEGHCLWGKIPLQSIYTTLEGSPNMSLGQKVEMTSPAEMQSCFMKMSCLNEDKCVLIQTPYNSKATVQVQVTMSAEEVGAKEKSIYNSQMCTDISPSMSRLMRLRAGNVLFNYRYYNNKLFTTEVTEDFSCPFCLVKCGSFKGLSIHLTMSHELFIFEFWVTDEHQAVNVTLRPDAWSSEIAVEGADPRQQTFFFMRRKRKNLVQNSRHPNPVMSESRADANSSKGAPTNDADSVQSVPGNNLAPPTMLQFAKTRKLSVERSDARNRSLLAKREFFHSHRAQPMAAEQVLSDRDSEDEVDDDVADLEDRRMLDDFVDVTKSEKQIMHLWNSFVRKQRVLADGHIPWACQAFSTLHGPELVHVPELTW
ncbi:hypothetical protein ACFE04_026965 [Oxalis oulophora]